MARVCVQAMGADVDVDADVVGIERGGAIY